MEMEWIGWFGLGEPNGLLMVGVGLLLMGGSLIRGGYRLKQNWRRREESVLRRSNPLCNLSGLSCGQGEDGQ